MTIDGARQTAHNMANRFAKPHVIYRLPAWPNGVFGVTAQDRGLPPEATIVETVTEDKGERIAATPTQGGFSW